MFTGNIYAKLFSGHELTFKWFRKKVRVVRKEGKEGDRGRNKAKCSKILIEFE